MTRKILLSLMMLLMLAGSAQADGPIRKFFRERMDNRSPDRAVDTMADIRTMAGMNVAIWAQPESPESLPAPLVLFSHGFGGCKSQSTFLAEALAANGYIVAAPDHKDASCGNTQGGIHRPEQKFGDYAAWSADTYKDRAADIKKLYESLQADKVWSRRIDFARVALMGHSLGGYTALGLAGAWPSWKMDGVKAVLALSPYVGPFLEKGSLGGITVPVMYQTGKRDFGIKNSLVKKGGAFEQTPAPAWLVEFDKTGHFGWTDLQADTHDNITRHCLWFLAHALYGDKTALAKQPGVSDLKSK